MEQLSNFLKEQCKKLPLKLDCHYCGGTGRISRLFNFANLFDIRTVVSKCDICKGEGKVTLDKYDDSRLYNVGMEQLESWKRRFTRFRDG